MPGLANALLLGGMAYLLGSISFAVFLTRWKTGIDVRTQGSGHAGATNAMRTAGWGVGILVAVLDVGKGFLAVYMARQFGNLHWAPAIAAFMVCVGHCWPIFAGFQGGMGVGCAVGTMLAVWPFGFVLAVGLGALLQLTLRHSARANFFTGLLVAPVWALAGGKGPVVAVAVGAGVVVAYRALSDWRRVYRELWLDRER